MGSDQSESCNLGGEGVPNLHYKLVEESDPGPLTNVNGIFFPSLLGLGKVASGLPTRLHTTWG